MNRFIPILDNGHGGIIGGKYQTAGKRSPNWKYGVLYEGAFNRWVVNRIKEELDREHIPYYHISPEDKDIPLSQRVTRANKIYLKNNNTYLLSIHANAGGGEGAEIYTYPGLTNADLIATEFMKDFKQLVGTKIRADYTDGDVDKEAEFYILKHSYAPAVLLEVGFMDNIKDYEKLWSKKFINDVVNSLTITIIRLYQSGLDERKFIEVN